MQVWHGTPDAPSPEGVRPGEVIDILIGTWPVEAGQEIAVQLTVTRPGPDAHTDGCRPGGDSCRE